MLGRAGFPISNKRVTRPMLGPQGLRSIDVPLRDRSVDLFMSAFAYCLDLNGTGAFFLDFLGLCIKMQLKARVSHQQWLQSPANLNFMNRHKTGKLSICVTSPYARALARTNHALSAPETAYADSTLASIYLLSVFKLLRSDADPKKSPETDAWFEHNNGAVALLVSRGVDRLKDTTRSATFPTGAYHVFDWHGVGARSTANMTLVDNHNSFRDIAAIQNTGIAGI